MRQAGPCGWWCSAGGGGDGIRAGVRAALAPFGDRYLLAPVDADKPWGQASTELVDLLYAGNAVGILAVGRNASHLAEQLAAKVFIPVVALSADASLTAVNLPWIFRLPAETAPEEAIGRSWQPLKGRAESGAPA